MFNRFLTIFRKDAPVQEIDAAFSDMLNIAQEMALEASGIYWRTYPEQERVSAVSKRDIEVNKLERAIRKKISRRLSVTRGYDVPYSLRMMSLVKDVERIGDYAKNLAQTAYLVDAPIPDDELTVSLREIREQVEGLIREIPRVMGEADKKRSAALTVEGRELAKDCDRLVRRLAKGEYATGVAVKLTLGARYYKRIVAHSLNLLSSVIMPLHKLDYYDEDDLNAMDEAP